MFKKGHKKVGGREKGVPNKLTTTIREMFEGAARDLGGRARLVQWAKESPENERVFWQLATKLLPLQLTGANGGPLQLERIERTVVEANPKPVIELTATTIEETEPVPADGKRERWWN